MRQLLCGAAERIVNPPVGLSMPGSFGPRYSTGVRDDLYTQAVVIDDGTTAVALVSIDILDYKASLTATIRRGVKQRLGVDVKVMTAATHTHWGSPTNYLSFGSLPDAKHIKRLIALTVDAIVEAYEKRVPVKAGYGVGEEKRISFCRNYYMTDGTIETNPFKRIQEVIKPVSAIDYSVGVLCFEDEQGKTLAQIVNFACHPCTMGSCSEYGADFPAELRSILKEKYGKECVVAFLNGCAGDVNHINPDCYRENPDFHHAKDHYKWMGRCLAETVLGINKNMKMDEEPLVACASKVFREKRRQPTVEQSAWAEEWLKNPTNSMTDRIYAEELHELTVRPRYAHNVEIQAVRIGDCALVALPGEIFSDVGFAIKKDSPFQNNMVVELGNGTYGYIVTEPCFTGGVYEAKLATDNSMFTPATADKMVKIAVELLNELYQM